MISDPIKISCNNTPFFKIGFIHDKKLSANFSLTARCRNVMIFICPFGKGKNNSRVVQ